MGRWPHLRKPQGPGLWKEGDSAGRTVWRKDSQPTLSGREGATVTVWVVLGGHQTQRCWAEWPGLPAPRGQVHPPDAGH